MNPEKQNCGFCKFWNLSNRTQYNGMYSAQCLRYPPVPFCSESRDFRGSPIAFWLWDRPWLTEQDTCGEFQPHINEETK